MPGWREMLDCKDPLGSCCCSHCKVAARSRQADEQPAMDDEGILSSSRYLLMITFLAALPSVWLKWMCSSYLRILSCGSTDVKKLSHWITGVISIKVKIHLLFSSLLLTSSQNVTLPEFMTKRKRVLYVLFVLFFVVVVVLISYREKVSVVESKSFSWSPGAATSKWSWWVSWVAVSHILHLSNGNDTNPYAPDSTAVSQNQVRWLRERILKHI